MTREELGVLLNTLLEAERAGAKLLAAYLDELPLQSRLHAALRDVQRDEARNCAIDGWPERLEFLNRGQAWVARRIAAALPRIPSAALKSALQAMHESHLVNIHACEGMAPAAAADVGP